MKRTPLLALVLALTLGAAACGEEAGRPAREVEWAEAPPGPETTPDSPSAFDPSELAIGERFLGLEVVEIDARRVLPDSVWGGRVRFRGPIRVEGVYRPHFDAPEVDALCLDVTHGSRDRVPVFLPDDPRATGRRSWFCFRDAERTRSLLGAPEPARRVTVIVDDYEATRYFTDAWDTAELVEVVESGEEAPRADGPQRERGNRRLGGIQRSRYTGG